MRRTGPTLRQQKDTCSCWCCQDEKYRTTRKTEKKKAIDLELEINEGIKFNDDLPIIEPERRFKIKVKIRKVSEGKPSPWL